MTDYAALRGAMIESQLRTSDVTDRRVLAAMMEIPREAFVPEALRPFAYLDRDLPLGPADGTRPPRFMMEPVAFARLLQLAGIGPEDRILDVGCAGGYSAAVLARLGAGVTALESDPALAAAAETALQDCGIRTVRVVTGPLEEGVPDQAGHDVIVLEGAVEEVPRTLLDQLAPGGRLVAIVGSGRAAWAMLYERLDGGLTSRPDFDRAAPSLPGFARPVGFSF